MAERVTIAPESSYGVLPVTGWVHYPFTGEDAGADFPTVRSRQITPDRNPRGAVRVGAEQGGGYNFEVELGVLNPLFPALFLAAPSTALAISGTISSSDSDNSFNGTGLMTNVQVGQVIEVGGLHASVNGRHHVTAKPSNDKIIVASTLTTQAGSGDETITGQMIRIGDTLQSLAVERAHTTEGSYFVALGQVVQNFRLEMRLRQLLTGRIGLFGPPEQRYDASQATTPTTAAGAEILGPTDHIANIRLHTMGADTGLDFSSVSLDWNNNFAGVESLGKFGIQRIQKKRPTITLSLETDFDNSAELKAAMDRVYSATRSAFSVTLEDVSGKALAITAHRIYANRFRANATGDEELKFVRFDVEIETDLSDPANPKSLQFDLFE